MDPDAPNVYLLVLGNMQDAGLPHAGCLCQRCRAAFANPGQVGWAACVALVDTRAGSPRIWLFDATPDIKYQLNQLGRLLGNHPTRPGRARQPDGIFLTHGHMGHTAGLVHFGPEAMDAAELPLYGPPGLIDVLRKTALWQPAMRAFDLLPLVDEQAVLLAPALTVTPLLVPHRDEWAAGTFAYRISGPNRTLLYLPDIDSWDAWPAARTTLKGVDIALVDACFYSSEELGARSPVAHPLVPDTLLLMEHLPLELVLTHLNHTNPLLDEESPERAHALASGAAIANLGDRFAL